MKLKYRYWIITLLWICSLATLQAQTDSIKVRIDSLLCDPLLNSTQLGLVVYDLTTDSTLYAYNARQTMRPASTMKLLTSVAALDALGAKYQFRTSLYYTGTVKDSVLTGNLYCVGGMDPLFDIADMQAFAASVKALGLHTIRGKLVEVRNFKDNDLLGEGWCWDDDNPTLSPLLIDKKDVFISRLVQQLDALGIFVDAPADYGTLPKQAKQLCVRTHPLTDVLGPMMKNSDNLFAEAMFYQLGASTGALPAKASHCRQVMLKTLQKAGVRGQYKIADGSGLSLYNYVTPDLLTRLLVYAYRQSGIIRHLYSSLPVSGEDGTLKSRMKDTPAYLNIRAKTGTVTGISSLAGYALSADCHILAFSIINQGVMKSDDGRNFQDKVCTALCK